MLIPESDELARAVLARSDVRTLERIAAEAGMIPRWERACAAVEDGLTSPAEIRRILGVATPPARIGAMEERPIIR
jgi:general secretion pathway protein E